MINQIDTFSISSNCELSGCEHRCKIILTDGRERTVNLDGETISALICSLSKDKIWQLADKESSEELDFTHFKHDEVTDLTDLIQSIFSESVER